MSPIHFLAVQWLPILSHLAFIYIKQSIILIILIIPCKQTIVTIPILQIVGEKDEAKKIPHRASPSEFVVEVGSEIKNSKFIRYLTFTLLEI